MNQHQILNKQLKLEHCLIPEARNDLRTNPNQDTFTRYTSLVEELELYQTLYQYSSLLEREHSPQVFVNVPVDTFIQRIRDYQRGAI